MFDFALLVSAITMVVLDYIYLSLLKGYFSNQVKKVQGSPLKFNLLAPYITHPLLNYKINLKILV